MEPEETCRFWTARHRSKRPNTFQNVFGKKSVATQERNLCSTCISGVFAAGFELSEACRTCRVGDVAVEFYRHFQLLMLQLSMGS